MFRQRRAPRCPMIPRAYYFRPRIFRRSRYVAWHHSNETSRKIVELSKATDSVIISSVTGNAIIGNAIPPHVTVAQVLRPSSTSTTGPDPQHASPRRVETGSPTGTRLMKNSQFRTAAAVVVVATLI